MSVYHLKNSTLKIFKHTFLISVAALCSFPLLWLISSSLKSRTGVMTDLSLVPSEFHWENYIQAWNRGELGIYLFNSFFYTAIAVFGVLFIASLAAYGFARLQFPGKEIIYYTLLLSMFVPIPASFIPIFVLLMKMHLLNTRLGYLLPLINGGLPVAIFIFRGFFESIPRDLEDAARIDGSGKWGIYWRIVLPLSKPVIAAVAIFNCLGAWKEFLLALVVFSDKHLMPVQRGLVEFQGQYSITYNLMFAGIVITIVPVLLFYALMQKNIVKGLTEGAIKA